MNLAIGTRLGPYELVSPVGAGGMGEVYRARDTRLDRTVAVKVLPAHLSNNPELRQRFEREARAVSSLQHPHICTLHDIGQQDGVDYLVMEFLEGQTLADRLAKGAMPIDQVLRYAIQIVDALDKAHHAGITHRDLKPGNIILTKSGAKLLDFGLAKFQGNDSGLASSLTSLPTERRSITAEGTILGTFQYMAPEQLEGREVDARTDIFAFGAVVYEMATGNKAFTGKSQASLITAIMSSYPPPISTIEPMTPPALDRVVKTCLAKDADDRWQTAHDLMLELQWIAEGGARTGGAEGVASHRKSRERLAWIVAGVLLLLLLVALPFIISHLRHGPFDTRAVRFLVQAPDGSSVVSLTISPDGRRLAFVTNDSSGRRRLWVQPLDSLTAQPLADADSVAALPFWSPDSRFIAFSTEGRLKKIDAAGGTAQTLVSHAENTGMFRGGSWGRDGSIIFAGGPTDGLYRVSDGGGEATAVTTLDQARENSHRWPQFPPDGRHFLYFSRQTPEKNGIYVGSLDSKETKRILDTDFNAVYAEPGYLLFMRESALMAQPFDADSLKLTGDAFQLADQVAVRTLDQMSLCSVSESGVLVYRSGGEAVNSELNWRDRTGKKISQVGPVGNYWSIWLSPDEKRVAVERLERGTGDIWLMDIARNIPTKFTFDPGWEFAPVWSPDGRIVFSSTKGVGPPNLYVKPASGSSNEELLLESNSVKIATDWSSDGKLILYSEENAKGKNDLWVLPLEGDRTPRPLVRDEFNKWGAKFSPDDKWVAYVSDKSGRAEVYIQPFPGPGEKYQVSTSGGFNPSWRRDGKELLYISNDRKLMALEWNAGATFEPGLPKALFDIRTRGGGSRTIYAVSSDGQRFLTNDRFESSTPSPITVVLNWTADLKR
jgi:Tol biopolymer transport system component/tRNA A-37 threonylcarbamoyl transferase component Bud32